MTEQQLDGQMSFFDLGMPSGKTYPEPSQATRERTSAPSSKPSAKSETKPFLYLSLKKANGLLPDALWETATALPGAYTTLNTGEFPSAGRESILSDVLDLNAPEKYSLSPRACAGIIRRAKRRGKELPPMLLDALMETVGLGGGLEKFDGDGE